MRKLPGVGVEYGTDWVITHILETELSPIDTDELFEEHIRGCYLKCFTFRRCKPGT